MASKRKQRRLSATAVAIGWLDRRLAIVLETAHRRTHRHVTAVALGTSRANETASDGISADRDMASGGPRDEKEQRRGI